MYNDTMKIKEGFELRDVCGEFIIVAFGEQNTVDMLAELLCQEYEVNPATALHDAQDIAQKWIEVGLVE